MFIRYIEKTPVKAGKRSSDVTVTGSRGKKKLLSFNGELFLFLLVILARGAGPVRVLQTISIVTDAIKIRSNRKSYYRTQHGSE